MNAESSPRAPYRPVGAITGDTRKSTAATTRWPGIALSALLIGFAWVGQAQAGVQACYDLAKFFDPKDVHLAYEFVKNHGECVANFEDPAFDAVAGTLTSLEASGALPPGQCSSIMNNTNTPAAKQLMAVADVGVIGVYLNCGCAVADSGIADKIKEVVGNVVSCAKVFDPSGPVFSGLEMAGDSLGFSTLWGLAGNDHDPRAGVGNGGAPTYAYDVAPCKTTGQPIGASWHAWDGSALPPGLHVQTCACPAPTRVYADGKFYDYGTVFNSPIFTCLACPPSQALVGGSCQACENVQKQNGSDIYGPNADGTACVLMGGTGSVTNPCQNKDKWNGEIGANSKCCAAWEKVEVGPTNGCMNICPPGRIYDGLNCNACPPDTQQVANACEACPSGSHSNYADTCKAEACPPGQGLLPGSDQCGVCPPDTQRKQDGHCEPCTQGAHSKGGDDFCSIAFPETQCFPGQAHPPGDIYSCEVCPANTQIVGGYCKPCPAGSHSEAGGSCVASGFLPIPACTPGALDADGVPIGCGKVCTGDKIRNPRQPGRCIACPAGKTPNDDHTACHPSVELAPVIQQIRQ